MKTTRWLMVALLAAIAVLAGGCVVYHDHPPGYRHGYDYGYWHHHHPYYWHDYYWH
jgi:hypothetical protein